MGKSDRKNNARRFVESYLDRYFTLTLKEPVPYPSALVGGDSRPESGVVRAPIGAKDPATDGEKNEHLKTVARKDARATCTEEMQTEESSNGDLGDITPDFRADRFRTFESRRSGTRRDRPTGRAAENDLRYGTESRGRHREEYVGVVGPLTGERYLRFSLAASAAFQEALLQDAAEEKDDTFTRDFTIKSCAGLRASSFGCTAKESATKSGNAHQAGILVIHLQG